jgi:hypothetical protein
MDVSCVRSAIRNNATTAQEVHELSSQGTIALMQGLANGERADEDATGRLRQFAAGCLINVRQIMEADRAGAQPAQGAAPGPAGGAGVRAGGAPADAAGPV